MATVRSKKAKQPRPAPARLRAVTKVAAKAAPVTAPVAAPRAEPRELVILTGMSGSGKLSALKAFEDLGFYSVDNLPLELIPRFADLVAKSAEITHAALVVDVREGIRLDRFPAILSKVRKVLPTRVVFLEASEEAIVRRFSETRRPHPLGQAAKSSRGGGETVIASIRAERKRLDPVRNVADIDDQCCVSDLRGFGNEVREARNQLQRQVVDRVVAEVLKRLERRGLAGARHPGEDDQLAGFGLGLEARRSRRLDPRGPRLLRLAAANGCHA